MKIKLAISIFFLTFFLHCKNNEEDFSSYRYTMLININEIIVNDYTLLEIRANELNQTIETYQSDGGLSNLTNSRTSWITFIEQWNKVKAYNILDVRYNLLHTFIYSKPNVSKIEQNIINKPNVSIAELSALGADQKGINTLEYLLFKDNNLATADSSFNFETNFASRKNLLGVVSEELKMQVVSLKNNWQNNYSPNLLKDTRLEVGSPLNEVFNQSIEVVTLSLKNLNENIANNNSQTLGYFSQTDLFQLKAAIEGVQIIFNANGKESFSSYLSLKTKNDKLSEKVDAAFKGILEDEVFNFDSFQTINLVQKERLKTKLRNLSALISIDVSSDLMILVTLSDTDGD